MEEYVLSLPYNRLSSQKYLLSYDSRIFKVFKDNKLNFYSEIIENIDTFDFDYKKKIQRDN